MTLKPETITQIQTMLQADPALLAQVQSLAEPVEAAAILVKAAAANGIDVNVSDVVAFAESARASQGAISDSELEQVAGGSIEFVMMSLKSLGFGCAIHSIVNASKGNDCDKALW